MSFSLRPTKVRQKARNEVLGIMVMLPLALLLAIIDLATGGAATFAILPGLLGFILFFTLLSRLASTASFTGKAIDYITQKIKGVEKAPRTVLHLLKYLKDKIPGNAQNPQSQKEQYPSIPTTMKWEGPALIFGLLFGFAISLTLVLLTGGTLVIGGFGLQGAISFANTLMFDSLFLASSVGFFGAIFARLARLADTDKPSDQLKNSISFNKLFIALGILVSAVFMAYALPHVLAMGLGAITIVETVFCGFFILGNIISASSYLGRTVDFWFGKHHLQGWLGLSKTNNPGNSPTEKNLLNDRFKEKGREMLTTLMGVSLGLGVGVAVFILFATGTLPALLPMLFPSVGVEGAFYCLASISLFSGLFARIGRAWDALRIDLKEENKSDSEPESTPKLKTTPISLEPKKTITFQKVCDAVVQFFKDLWSGKLFQPNKYHPNNAPQSIPAVYYQNNSSITDQGPSYSTAQGLPGESHNSSNTTTQTPFTQTGWRLT